MTTVIQLCLVIITALILVLAGFLISLIIQIRKTAREAEITLRKINDEINPLLSKINDTVANFRNMSEELNRGVTSTAKAVRGIESVVGTITKATSLLSVKGWGSKLLASSLWIGVKAGVDIVKNRFLSKKR